MIFGSFSSGNANAFGPDVNRAKLAAEKIFKITETPSEIDALAGKSESYFDQINGK